MLSFLKAKPTVFVVGCPRSGTTLLQTLLATHSDIVSFPETKYFIFLQPEREPRRKKYGVVSRQLYPVLEAFFSKDLKRPDVAKRLPKVGFIGWYTRVFFGLLHDIGLEYNKNIVVEKTPEHIDHLDEIERYVPNSKVVHIVRNGPEVAASMYEVSRQYPKWWKGASSLDYCVNRWIETTQRSLTYSQKENHYVVRYELLVRDPEAVLVPLCEFLGVPFEAGMLTNYRKTSASLLRDREKWKQKVSQVIQLQKSDRFDRVFDEEQKQYVFDRIAEAGLSH
ncbi:sulfotransferase family protein, partial [Baaleninema sp.]|uniref:sulfotransferase family protein n=1 Tax=Baaleninema sp. TaxID=3101197 RepID=UPI003D080526